MNTKKLLIILLIFVVIIGCFGVYIWSTGRFLVSQTSQLNGNTIQPTKEVFNYKKTTYFLPIVGIKNDLTNLTPAILSNSPLLAITEDQAILEQITDLKDLKINYVETFDELSKDLNSNMTHIGILNFNYANARVKTVSYNGVFLLNKNTDLNQYTLKFTQDLQSNEKTADISNYDPVNLRVIGHTGSMISARGVKYWIESKFGSDYTRLFKNTKPLFDSFDYLSSTFEAPVQGVGRPCDQCFTFVGPEKFMDGVKYSGIDMYTMAANHIMDGGVSALDNTQKKLDELGIKYTGASTKNNDDAGKPVLVDVNGLKIAYLGFNDTPGRSEWADDTHPGAASISDWEISPITGATVKYEPNLERIKYFIKRAKDLNPDLTIVMMHWGGVEYENDPTSYVKNLAKILIENGVDIIFGDHPHWVQKIDFIEGKPVFYSVGNFIFDQMWSIETREGMTIEVELYKNKPVNFKLHPHLLDLYQNGTIQLLTPDQKEYKDTLNRIYSVSEFE